MGATCPECAEEISAKPDAELGMIMGCPSCGTRLEIMCLVPLKIEPAPALEEDWGE